jgi:hypothetical protein
MTLTVRVNAVEYSRYYDMNLVKITASTNAVDTTVATFRLVREDGFGTVTTKTGVVTAGKATATVDLAKDAFDADGIYRARYGKYHITATLPNLETADSAMFWVMPVTVRELKDKYLRGIDLLATNILEPQNWPFASLTGVEIVNTATTQMRGIFPLAWDGTAKTLTWDSGTAYTVDMTKSVISTQLINSKRSAYIEVSIVPDVLPTGSVTEQVILDFAEIEDDTLRSFLQDAYHDIQGRLFVALEPTTYDTERVGDTSYDPLVFTDEYTDPLTFYRDLFFPADKFLVVRFPHPWIFQHGFKRLEFFFNSTKTATIDISQWIVNMTKGNTGLVEFVPRVGATLIFAWFTTAGLAFLTRWASIPSAWHYRVTAGLPDLMNDGRDRVRAAIARRAAIEALVLAGLASAPGLTSENTSKDGVSQSKSYAQGPGGRYSQIVAQHVMFLFGSGGIGGPTGGEILKLRQRLLGLYGTTL